MSCTVFIEPSGKTFSIERGESILDAAMRNGISLPYGCRNAVCGSCKSKLIEGTVDYAEYEPLGLNNEELKQGMVLLCQAKVRSDVRIEAHEITSVKNIETRKLPARIDKLQKLAPDVMRLFLRLPPSQRMQFLAGQYIDIIMQDGRRRSFSIANSPYDDAYIELHIRHVENGELSDQVFSRMNEKDILRIEGPYGNFYLRDDDKKPIIFMAGGTGFAPIKGIIEYAMRNGLSKNIYLYWGAKSKRDLYLDGLARQWDQQHNFKYIPVLSEPAVEDNWQGRQGFVHQAILEDFSDLSQHNVYTAGPPPMVTAGYTAFTEQGLPKEHYFSDAFEYSQV